MPSYTIHTQKELSEDSNQRKFVRTSNGNLHCVYLRTIADYIQICYAKSTDNGVTWEETVLTSGDYYQEKPSIAVDSNDYLHVVWNGIHSGSPTIDQIRYAKSIDNGVTWGDIENLTSGDYYQYGPSIAVDSNDYLHVVWYGKHSGSTLYDQIRYIKYTTSWGSIENLTSGDYNQSNPSIAIDSNNYIHIVWNGIHSGSPDYSQIRYIKYTTSWGSIENLTSGNYDQYGPPSIAVDSNDYLHVVWNGIHSGFPTIDQIRYIKYTTSWGSIENLTSGDYNQFNPSIAVDSNDYLHVVWHGWYLVSPDYSQIRYIKYITSWGSIENLTSASVNQEDPYLLWSFWPTIGGAKINRPKDGYTFIWDDDIALKIYLSSDLEWSLGLLPCVITDPSVPHEIPLTLDENEGRDF